jgi:AraC-like DNA-binding protein
VLGLTQPGFLVQRVSKESGRSRYRELQVLIEYLTRWRMLLAADRLANNRDSIFEIARSLGYESASAFTNAFKKIMGRSPRQYSRDQNSVSPPYSEDEAAHAIRSNLSSTKMPVGSIASKA